MTDHYFENDWVTLHYYKFGNGPKVMLGFHGYGMHGGSPSQFGRYERDNKTCHACHLLHHLTSSCSMEIVCGETSGSDSIDFR